jgi:hypothetical protein
MTQRLLEKEPEIVAELLPEPKKSKRGANLRPYHFKPGQSGNPGGRPVGARNTLTGGFLKALSADFEKHGANTIQRARKKDPVSYMKIIAGMLPKQLEKVQPLEELSDAELSAGIALLKSKLSVSK